MLDFILDHNHLDFTISDEKVHQKYDIDPHSLTRLDLQSSGLMTVSLSDYGLDNIVLKASLNTWFNLSKQGDLFMSTHGNDLKCTYDHLTWLPSMYPLLYPIGITGPDLDHREIHIALEDYVQHQLQIKDDRFSTHETFMFAMYNIIQRRNVSRSLRFAIRGKELFNITTEDLKSSLEQLLAGESIRNIQVQRLFNKVIF